MDSYIKSTTWAVVTEENGRIFVRQSERLTDDVIRWFSLRHERGPNAVVRPTSNGTLNEPPESR